MLNRIPQIDQNLFIIKKMGFDNWETAISTINPKGYLEKSIELQPYFKISNIEEISGYGYFLPTKSLNAETDDRMALESAARAQSMKNTVIFGIIIVAILMAGGMLYKMVT
jgi:hypothetical protein